MSQVSLSKLGLLTLFLSKITSLYYSLPLFKPSPRGYLYKRKLVCQDFLMKLKQFAELFLPNLFLLCYLFILQIFIWSIVCLLRRNLKCSARSGCAGGKRLTCFYKCYICQQKMYLALSGGSLKDVTHEGESLTVLCLKPYLSLGVRGDSSRGEC